MRRLPSSGSEIEPPAHRSARLLAAVSLVLLSALWTSGPATAQPSTGSTAAAPSGSSAAEPSTGSAPAAPSTWSAHLTDSRAAATTPRSGQVRYVRPVPGEVLRPFEPGPSPYGPGHRGVDLAAPIGAAVGAAADGHIRHAGPVAGTVWVSIDHADGITTSYGPLTDLRVRRGDEVRAGTALGALRAGGHGHGGGDRGLHWGARRDGTYLDPLSLLGAPRWRPSLIGAGGWRGIDLAVQPYEPWEGQRWGGLGVAPSPVADRPGFAVPPNPNHLVLIRGLGSSSDDLPFDPADLGYDPGSVTAHSYAGRLPVAPGPSGPSGSSDLSDPSGPSGPSEDPWRAQRPYGPEHTWLGVEAASLHLRDQLRARWLEEPGRAVDLVGYSMGGVVALHYLTHHHDPHDPTLPPIGHVVALAAPLQGSDLAALGAGVRDHPHLSRVVGSVRDRGALQGLPPLQAAALEDLRPGSRVLEDLAAGWGAAVTADTSGALAMGTRVLTVAGSRDQIVGARRTPLPAAGPGPGRGSGGEEPYGPVHLHRVLPGGHGGVLGSEALREVTWRFLAGQEVVASPGHLASLLSHGQGESLRSTGELVRLHGRLTTP